MAPVSQRRALIYKIQKRLCNLSESQLLQMAKTVGDGKTTGHASDLSEPELYDWIVDYIRSEELEALEDGGMAQLLFLDDMLSDLLVMDREADEVLQTLPSDQEVSNTQPQGYSTSPHHCHAKGGESPASPNTNTITQTLHMDRNIHTIPPTAGKDGRMSAKNSATFEASKRRMEDSDGASQSSILGHQVLRVNDVAALFPRREFRLHGGQISDNGSEMSYSCLCKQIDEGSQEGFTDSEIIQTVLKVIKPGTFRDMLVNKGDLKIDELKRFLRAHIRDKNSTELFQELSSAKQLDKESPQQFLYRLMGLKQRVLFESEQPGAEFKYDKRLVQGTFLHTLYQGLNEKNNVCAT